MSPNAPRSTPDFGAVDVAPPPSTVAMSNGVLLAAVIFLFMVVVFVFLLYLYAKRFLGANPLLGIGGASARFVYVATSPFTRRGLDAAVLAELPVTAYRAADFAEPLECAVCLSELADGEKARILPKCGHGFHLECIDMWFHSHSTCPLCRSPVGPEQPGTESSPIPPHPEAAASDDTHSPDFPMFPTNVLFWGTQDAVNAGAPATAEAAAGRPQEASMPTPASSSSGSGARKHENFLVIDIPRRTIEGLSSPMSPLPASRMAGTDDMRSPMSARLRSLRKLLTRGTQAVGTSCSPRAGGDIEQGMGETEAGHTPRTPKTPTN